MNKEQVLAVLDAEIAALPTMADMATTGGIHCDPTAAIERLTEVRAAIVALYEENERLDKHLSGLAAEWRLDAARLRRIAKNDLDSAYHMAAQDSEAHAQELDDARSAQWPSSTSPKRTRY